MRNVLLASAATSALFYSLPAEAQTCTAAPSCSTLGYTKTAAQCSGKNYTRCPFDTSKYNCDNGTTSTDCQAAGFIDSPRNCAGDYVACPGNTSYVKCLQGAKVGDLKYSLRTSDHDGWLLCNGGTYNHREYPELYAVIGDLFGNKRPNYVGYFLKGAASASTTPFKTKEEAGLPDISGRFLAVNSGYNIGGASVPTAAGAFSTMMTFSTNIRASGGDDSWGKMYQFLASAYNDIYGKSTTVTPQNYPANIFIYAGRRVSGGSTCESLGYKDSQPKGYYCQEKTVGSTKCYTNCRPESVFEQCRKKYTDTAYVYETGKSYPNSAGWCYGAEFDDCGVGSPRTYSIYDIESDAICADYSGELIESCDLGQSCMSSEYGISI